MRRKDSHDRRYKKSVWTQNQKLEAVSTYLMLGNMAETAIVTGIPHQTLKVWKTADWFKEFALQLKTEDVQQMDSNMKRIINKALKATEDRIKEEVERTIDDRLLRLSEEFAKFASSHKITVLDKAKTIDVQTVEIR